MTAKHTDRLPSLNAVRCFEAAARLQSFTLAAQELHVTQGAVSRMVQVLEQDLGVQLFARNGRFIALTSVGQAYHRDVSEALGRIRAASNLTRRAREGEALSVVVSSAFATRWLVPRLPLFQKRHPSVQVAILATERDDNTGGNPAQVRIRYGTGPWPGCVASRLPVAETLGVVCSPMLRTHSTLQHPQDLVGRPLLAYTGESRNHWPEYFETFGLAAPDLGQVPRFHQLLMLAEAAVSGLGFALVPLSLFEQELRSGRLVQALEQTISSKRGYFVSHPKGADADSRVFAFKEWLMSEAGRQARLGGPG